MIPRQPRGLHSTLRPKPKGPETGRKDSVEKKSTLAQTQDRNYSVQKEPTRAQPPGPAQKFFKAFVKGSKGKVTNSKAWQQKEEEPMLDFYCDDEMCREMDAELERKLQQGIKKAIFADTKESIKGKEKRGTASKVLLPRLEGSKTVEQISLEMSRELREDMERDGLY